MSLLMTLSCIRIFMVIVGVLEKEFVETEGIDGREVIVPERVEQHRDDAHTLVGSDSDELDNSRQGN